MRWVKIRAMSLIPLTPGWLGLAGLLPQSACLVAVLAGPPEWRWTGLALAWGYGALIFSFLGGMWWGLAAAGLARDERVPRWLWVAAIAPSLLALLTYAPWILGYGWPGPSLLALGVMIAGSLLVDRRLGGLAPHWWMKLRRPLSLALGGMTFLLGLFA